MSAIAGICPPFKAIDEIEQIFQESKTSLALLNQSILAKAFRGELVKQDPNDELASVLLDRIRAEREKAQGSKGTKGRKSRSRQANKSNVEQMTLPELSNGWGRGDRSNP